MVERRSKEEVEEVVVAEEPLTVAQTGPDRGKLLPPERWNWTQGVAGRTAVALESHFY